MREVQNENKRDALIVLALSRLFVQLSHTFSSSSLSLTFVASSLSLSGCPCSCVLRLFARGSLGGGHLVFPDRCFPGISG